jgi:hypothetical protein
MFSKKYNISKDEIKSCLLTAIKATITYFGITITILYQNIMNLNWYYFVSILVFFALVFVIKFIEKWLRDGDEINKSMAKDLLDQKISPQDKE